MVGSAEELDATRCVFVAGDEAEDGGYDSEDYREREVSLKGYGW